MTYPISRQAVAQRIALWDTEAAIYFCRLATRPGVTFTNIVYPTGLKMVRAAVGNEKVEVKLPVAKQLRADQWRIRC
jgi:hypothetical protein